MSTRICRECQTRFVPAMQHQSCCNDCLRARREVEVIDHYMRRSPGESIARIAIATGISEDLIRDLVAEGRLAATPVDHKPPSVCSCPPGETGRCPACRSRLARQFGEARWAAVSDRERQLGLRVRHSSRHPH